MEKIVFIVPMMFMAILVGSLNVPFALYHRGNKSWLQWISWGSFTGCILVGIVGSLYIAFD